MKIYWMFMFVVCLTLVLGSLVDADAPWTSSISLYKASTDSYDPAIVADSTGMVHVFWGESNNPAQSDGNVIMYTNLYGKVWSQPVDILFSPEGAQGRSWRPRAAISKDGRIHLVWVGGYNSQILYSSAHAGEAMSARAWTKPVYLSEIGVIDFVDISIDEKGKIHVIFTVQTGKNQGIYYLNSQDNGTTWTTPQLIPRTPVDAHGFLHEGRLTVGGDGTLHVIWWWTLRGFPPDGVRYIRSVDGGATWTGFLSMDVPCGASNVAHLERGEMMLVMTCTGSDKWERSLYYRRSFDSGQSWSPITRFGLAPTGGLAGRAGMIVDNTGTLHLAVVQTFGSVGDVVMYSQWSKGGWSYPEVIMTRTIKEQQQYNVDLAVSEGNILHLVTMNPLAAQQNPPYQWDVYYSRRQLNSPRVPPVPLPSLTPIPTLTSTPARIRTNVPPTQGSTPILRPPSRVDASLPVAGEVSASPVLNIIVGVVPVLLLLGILFVVRVFKHSL